MKKLIKSMVLLSGLTVAGLATAASSEMAVDMFATAPGNTQGASIGTVLIKESPKGLVFTVNLKGLTPGQHGFHVHEAGSCADMGKAAMGHFDPAGTHEHRGPQGAGHLGDLQALMVGANGTDTETFVVPHLTRLAEITGRSLIIHKGGDNYSDNPKLGGGGARVACGVIQ